MPGFLATIHLIFIGFVGLTLGSFASLLAYRWPRGLPWVHARSRCPACGHILGARDLMPLLSWALAGGRCRYCREPISIRYPLLEILCAGICLTLYAVIGWQWLLMPVLALVPVLMAGVLISFQKG